jgi:hypothetical protein
LQSRTGLEELPMRRFVTRSSGRDFGFLGWLALGLGIGIAGFTLLEPTRGAARRAALREKTSSGLRRLGTQTRDRLQDARSRVRGAIEQRRNRLAERSQSRSVSSLHSPDSAPR